MIIRTQATPHDARRHNARGAEPTHTAETTVAGDLKLPDDASSLQALISHLPVMGRLTPARLLTRRTCPRPTAARPRKPDPICHKRHKGGPTAVGPPSW
jgi:hypothetical protein